MSQGNTLLTQGFLGFSFLFYCFTLIVVFDATHLPPTFCGIPYFHVGQMFSLSGQG
ncbi:hypothetical protein ACQKE0_03565 [Shewanella colwelliana]|uniref:hypothetical protein n=1 Tax=Shewanella colwelliana TaxID=23 RepID=UPI003D01313C